MRALLVFALLATSAHAETIVHQDRFGNRTGETRCQGNACTDYDKNGNRQGSSIVRDNTIIYRDKNGNQVGQDKFRR